MGCWNLFWVPYELVIEMFAPFQQFETKTTASFDLGSIHIWRQMFLGYFWPTYPGAPPARCPCPGKLRPPDRRILFCKIKVRPRSCRSYPIAYGPPAVPTYLLDVLYGQPIKHIQVAFNSELLENQWNDLLFFEIVPSHCFRASEASKIDCFKN